LNQRPYVPQMALPRCTTNQIVWSRSSYGAPFLVSADVVLDNSSVAQKVVGVERT